MKAGARRVLLPGLLMLSLAGCDRAVPDNGLVVVPAEADTPVAATPLPANTSIPADRVEPLAAATPMPESAPAPSMPVRKDFTDPPLPPELQQDGDLKPLPKRPNDRTANGKNHQGEEKPL